MAITCVDQLIKDKITIAIFNMEVYLTVTELMNRFKNDLSLHKIFLSSGPTRDTIEVF